MNWKRRKEVAVAYFNVLSEHLSGGTENPTKTTAA
jgi:hypothetical protein